MSPNSNLNQNGFTLIETVIAMVILAAALLLLTSSWSGSFMRIAKTQRNFEVSVLLEKKMAEVELEYRNKALDDIPEEKGPEEFGEDHPEYQWKLESKKLEIPDIASTLAAQDGGADAFLISLVKQLTEGLSKMIKEVKVTVIYTKNGKTNEYSVTTYFVDYNKEMTMGMPGGA